MSEKPFIKIAFIGRTSPGRIGSEARNTWLIQGTERSAEVRQEAGEVSRDHVNQWAFKGHRVPLKIFKWEFHTIIFCISEGSLFGQIYWVGGFTEIGRKSEGPLRKVISVVLSRYGGSWGSWGKWTDQSETWELELIEFPNY